MEYANFVKDLATVGLNSPRCPPETQYAREFEYRMEELLVNYEIADGDSASPRSSRSLAPKRLFGKSSSFATDNGEDVSDRSSCGSDRATKLPAGIYQTTNGQESPYSFDSGKGLSSRYSSSCSSVDGSDASTEWNDFICGLPSRCDAAIPDGTDNSNSAHSESTYERSMNMSWQNEVQEMVEEICITNPPLNASMFPQPRSLPAKRTYDEANT